MDELIDIVTQDGQPTGKTALKSEVHSKGYYHNTAHVWFYTSDGKILLAQRAATKTICPLLWDVSVAGHVDAGETVEQAALREVLEEIGVEIKESSLYKVGIFSCFQAYYNGIVDNEFHYTFIAEFKVNIDEVVFNTEEVEAIKLVSISEFQDLLEGSHNNGHFIASNKTYYLKVLSCIKKKLSSL